jgi:hypothetical protein
MQISVLIADVGKEELDGTTELCLRYCDNYSIPNEDKSMAICAALGYCVNAMKAQSDTFSKLEKMILLSISKGVLWDDNLARALVRFLSSSTFHTIAVMSNTILPNLQYKSNNDKFQVTQVYYTMSRNQLARFPPQSLLSCLRGSETDQRIQEYSESILLVMQDFGVSISFALLGIVKSLQEYVNQDTRISRKNYSIIKKQFLQRLLADLTVDSLLLLAELIQIDSQLVELIDATHTHRFLTAFPALWIESFVSYESYMQDSKESIYFSSNGLVSRTIGQLVTRLLTQQEFAGLARFFDSLAQKFADFEKYCDHEFCDSHHSEPTNERQAKLWKFLKTVLFSYLLITESFCKGLVRLMGIPCSKEITVSVQSSVFCILSSLRNMHFVTARFGLGGLPLFETQIAVICAFAVRSGMIEPLFKEFKVQASLKLDDQNSMVRHCRLSFSLQVLKHIIHFLDDTTLEVEVEPLLKKHFVVEVGNQGLPLDLIKKDIRDLSHIACLNLFSLSFLQKNAIRRLTIPYVQILIENWNNGIDSDLVREAMRSVVKGLSDFSPSVTEKVLSARFKKVLEADVVESSIHLPATELTPEYQSSEQDEWKAEAAELAWQCIQALVLYLHDPPLRDSTVSILKDPNMAKAFSQTALLLILFDQIEVIAFQKLQELLQLVSDLMLHGFDDEGFGIVRSQELSPLWNALFDAISDPNRVDYSRRYDCVVWYLDLYNKAGKLPPNTATVTTRPASVAVSMKARL